MAKNEIKEFNDLTNKFLTLSNKGINRVDLLYEMSRDLMSFSEADSVELWLQEGENYIRTKINRKTEYAFEYNILPVSNGVNNNRINHQKHEVSINNFLKEKVIKAEPGNLAQFFTEKGSFNSGNYSNFLNDYSNINREVGTTIKNYNTEYNSLAMLPIEYDESNIGVMILSSARENLWVASEIAQCENAAKYLGIAFVNHRTHTALQERVKELNCLYQINQLSAEDDKSLEEILKAIVDKLPSGWQFPDIAAVCIVLDGMIFQTVNYKDSWQKQIADIVVQRKVRGFIEVAYTQTKPELDEGPFLREERNLIDAAARQIALIVERKESERDRLELQKQLQHADRLALVGEMAAGVAHELNEPLGSILGFAQLVKKIPEFPGQAESDIDKIIKAALYSREMIKKLMFFTRQASSKSGKINLNDVVEDSLYFFEAKCQKTGIELEKSLAPGIPEIQGDQSSFNQVLINLVVNSIHAMPRGGDLKIRTSFNDNNVILIVEDTGMGMSEEVKNKIFLPFFTTKDVEQGTGLGLAVVHNIVTSHKGKIKFNSEVGRGTRFEIHLPIS